MLRQRDLAEAVGISYQQLQKYERGISRISAGRLYQFAEVLEVSIVSFFDGLDLLVPGDVLDLSLDHMRLIKNYESLPDIQQESLQGYLEFLVNNHGEDEEIQRRRNRSRSSA